MNSLRLIERVVDLVTKRHICVEHLGHPSTFGGILSI